MRKKVYLMILALLTGAWLHSSAVIADTPPAETPLAVAGKIGSLEGDVWVQGALVKDGDQVLSGSRIKTGTKSTVTILLMDNSMFSLGSNSEMAVNDFSYDKETNDGSLSTNIFKGTFRFVSGLIARYKPGNMNVRLGPVATIGIRGTHVAGEVTERTEADGKITEASATVILMEPEDDPDRPTSILVANAYGSVVVDKPGYGTEIPDEHSPPTPVRKMQIRTIENITRVLRNTTPKHIPKPRMP